MVSSSIIEYIKKYRDQYPIEQLRSYLIQQGYNPFDVEQAIKLSTQPKKKKINYKLISFFVIGILIATLGYVFLSITEEERIFIRYEALRLRSTEINQGEDLFFTSTLSTNTKKTIDGTLTYKLADNSNNVFVEETENIKLKESLTKSYNLPTKNVDPGIYKLIASLNAIGKTAQRSSTVTIQKSAESEQQKDLEKQDVEKPANLLECPAECNDLNSCTKDVCIKGRCVFEEITPCCGNNICESGEEKICSRDCEKTEQSKEEILNAAKNYAQKNPELASQTCSKLAESNDCFYTIYKETKNVGFCEKIKDSNNDLKDDCYLDYATTKKDYTYCDKIQDELFSNYCYNVKAFGKG